MPTFQKTKGLNVVQDRVRKQNPFLDLIISHCQATITYFLIVSDNKMISDFENICADRSCF